MKNSQLAIQIFVADKDSQLIGDTYSDLPEKFALIPDSAKDEYEKISELCEQLTEMGIITIYKIDMTAIKPIDDFAILDGVLFCLAQIAKLENGYTETNDSMAGRLAVSYKTRRLTIKDADSFAMHMKFHLNPIAEYLQHKLNQ